MESPQRSLNWRNILKRANSLGIVLFGVLLAGAGVLFLLLGLLGWDNIGIRAMVSMLLSPLVVGIVFGFSWLAMRAASQTTPDNGNATDE